MCSKYKTFYFDHVEYVRNQWVKVMFAAMRIYAQEMKRPIRSGIVEISSDYAKAAYSCYKKAFKMNGFSTVMPKPPRPKVLHYIVIFTRDVFQTPKITFLITFT